MKFDLPKDRSSIIKVIGVGGGGSNAVTHMFNQGITGVDFIICNTDQQALEMSGVPNKVQLGATLTEGRGAGSIPEVGKNSAIVTENDANSLLIQRVARLRQKENSSIRFIYQHINSIRFHKYVDIVNTSSGIPHISSKQINDFSILFPALPEQQKIATFLTAVDDKIQQLTKKKTLLEQYKKGVMQKIFKQEIRFKDEDGKEFTEWKDKRLADFLIPTLREIDKPKKKYLAIGLRSHCKGTFQKPNSEPGKIAMDKLFVVKENDLVVNITFAWENI